MGLLGTLSSALARVDDRLEQAASLARHGVAALGRIAAAHPDSAKTMGHCRLTVANALARIDKALKETP